MSLEELRKGGYLMDETQWLRVRSPPASASSFSLTDPYNCLSAYPISGEYRRSSGHGCSRIAPFAQSAFDGELARLDV